MNVVPFPSDRVRPHVDPSLEALIDALCNAKRRRRDGSPASDVPHDRETVRRAIADSLAQMEIIP